MVLFLSVAEYQRYQCFFINLTFILVMTGNAKPLHIQYNYLFLNAIKQNFDHV